MLKNAGLLFFMPCVLFVGMWGFASYGPHARMRHHVQDVAAREESQEERINRRMNSRRIFVMLMHPTLEELGTGRMTLREASERIIAYSKLHHEEYLRNVGWAENGQTPLEKVAQLLAPFPHGDRRQA